MKEEDIVWHHGTCDYCDSKMIVVAHYGYDKQGKEPRQDWRLCRDCLRKGLGWYQQQVGVKEYPGFQEWVAEIEKQ